MAGASHEDHAWLVAIAACSTSVRAASTAPHCADASPWPAADPPPTRCSPCFLTRSTNVFVHHGSSPLRLVGLLLACSHYLWSAIYLLYLQVSYAWCCIALPLLALLPVRNGRAQGQGGSCAQARALGVPTRSSFLPCRASLRKSSSGLIMLHPCAPIPLGSC